MGMFNRYYACLNDERGEFIKFIKFNMFDTTFKYKSRCYNVLKNKSSCLKIKGLLFNNFYYFYTINNSNPFVFDDKQEPILNSEIYNALLETKVINDINEISKDNFLLKLLNPKNIIIGLIILAVIIYFANGGTIT